VNNELPKEFNGTVTARVLNLDMKEVFRQNVNVRIGAEGLATNVLAINFPTNISPVHFIKLELADAKGRAVSQNFYWRSDKAYTPGRTWTGPQYEGFEDLAKLPKVKLATEVKWSRAKDENVCMATVKNPSRSLAFMVWLRLQHTGDGKPVRPAFYGDNFFSLLPGESRTVQIKFDDAVANSKQVQLLVDGWNEEREIFIAGNIGAARDPNESRNFQ
jgi:mannosylglycoprotein endo-beta-mannosidase